MNKKEKKFDVWNLNESQCGASYYITSDIHNIAVSVFLIDRSCKAFIALRNVWITRVHNMNKMPTGSVYTSKLSSPFPLSVHLHKLTYYSRSLYIRFYVEIEFRVYIYNILAYTFRLQQYWTVYSNFTRLFFFLHINILIEFSSLRGLSRNKRRFAAEQYSII